MIVVLPVRSPSWYRYHDRSTDRGLLGRAFAIVPRSWQPRGYVDFDDDDYTPEKHWIGGVMERAKVPSQDTA